MFEIEKELLEKMKFATRGFEPATEMAGTENFSNSMCQWTMCKNQCEDGCKTGCTGSSKMR